MTKDDIYDLCDSTDPEKRIVGLIYNDLADRRGLSDALDSVDEEILTEMIEGWIHIVGTEMGL